MSRKLFVILFVITGMGGLFIAQESRSNERAIDSGFDPIKADLDSMILAIDSLFYSGNYDQIIQKSKSAEKLIQANAQDSFYLSLFRQHRGNALYYLGDYDEAIELFNRAIAASTSDEVGLKQRATQLFDRANAEYQLELMTDCYRSTLASESILSRLENPDYDYLISVYTDLAFQSRELAFYDDARKFLNKARAVYLANKELVDAFNLAVSKPVSFTYNELLINAEAKQEQKMLSSLNELELLVDPRTSRKAELVRLSSAYTLVADFYINDLHAFTQEKLTNAKKYLQRANKTLDIKENPNGLDQLRFNEAKLTYNIGEYATAKVKFEALCGELSEGDPRRPFFEIMKAMTYMKLGETEKAADSFFETLAITHSGQESLRIDGSNYEPSTNIIHATLFAEVADTIQNFDPGLFDQIGGLLQMAGMREFEFNYHGKTFNARLKSTFESLFQGLLDPLLNHSTPLEQKHLYAALINQSEAIENRLLWSKFLLNRRKGQLKVPDSIRRMEQILRLKIVETRRSGDTQSCFEFEKELERLEREILRDYPIYGQFSQANFKVSELQNQLSEDQMVLKFLELSDCFYRFTITKKSIECKRIPRSEELRKAVSSYLDVIQNKRENCTLASSIADQLLPADYPNFRKVVVVNNLIFGDLPFEALCDRKGEYLVKNTQITYAPHLVFINGKSPTKDDNGEITVFQPEYSNNQLDLRGAKGESESISERFNSSYFAQEEATRMMFLEASTDARVLHLSMHTEISDSIGEQSCFLFNDKKLYLDELYGLNLKGQMAVLSACNTGRSFKDVRNGNTSLQRAFVYAGITSTLSSLWEIPDRSTEKIMISFYENLEKGMTNGAAIQAAKRSFLARLDDPHLRAPYFWAGFILSGQDQTIEIKRKEANSSWWVWFLPIGGLVVLAIVFFKKRDKKRVLSSSFNRLFEKYSHPIQVLID